MEKTYKSTVTLGLRKIPFILLVLIGFMKFSYSQNYVQVNITQPEVLTVSVIGTEVHCFGASTGAVDLTTTGGTVAYSYSWSTGDSTEDIINLPAATYSVTVSDVNGCTTTTSITINQPAAPLAATIAGTDLLCSTDSTGAADITVSGGTLAYSYLWNTGDTTADLFNLPAGTYSITVSDSNNCSATATVSINQPTVPATPVITQNGNDLISSSATGNQWYELTTGIITGDTGQTYTVTASGDYFVIVSNGICSSDTSNIIPCTIVNIITIEGNSFISIFPNPTKDVVKVCLHNLENKNIKVDVFNSIGQTIFAKQFITAESDMIETFDLSKLNDGIFLFKFEYDNNWKIFWIIKN